MSKRQIVFSCTATMTRNGYDIDLDVACHTDLMAEIARRIIEKIAEGEDADRKPALQESLRSLAEAYPPSTSRTYKNAMGRA